MSDEYDRIVSMGWGSATSGDVMADTTRHIAGLVWRLRHNLPRGGAYDLGQEAAAALTAIQAERDAALARATEWRNDFRALEAAIVGDTGLSAMLVATQARLFKARAEAAEADAAKARRFRDIARDEVKEWHEVAVIHAARVAELEAAVTHAYERGRDDAAHQASAYMIKAGFFDANKQAETIGYLILALPPPADLGKGAADD